MLAFLRRRLTGEYEVDEFGFDPELNDKVLLELLRPFYRHWFRVETSGLQHIPVDSGALVVANHSGTLPVDALMLQVALHDEARRPVRLLGADLVYQLPVLGHLARKTGHTLACPEDADRLLRKGELVGVFPEGFKGVGKPFSERYKLQRFGRGGFAASAIRTGVPIIPCAIVGAEEIYPKIGDVPVLARLLGLPYLPITPFFPWLGPLGLVPLPSKWLIEFGEPIMTNDYDPIDADDPMLVFNLTDQVRETIQSRLDALRLRRGPAFPAFSDIAADQRPL
ncbi:lysophospholipid acyltransferase family protein [Microtetraspora fusca]|uniref:lysophospholipid acyltransferase family protein n=1 Tax=Microtetraspora fusca TaxID=1997 RepID=UPI000A002E0D|nr:lysophospholipid acyltransferase family protein [Microtetraspora fusca]